MAPVPVEQGQSGQQPDKGLNDNAQNLNNMIDDVDKLLYDGCAKFSIFSAIVVLFQLKSFYYVASTFERFTSFRC